MNYFLLTFATETNKQSIMRFTNDTYENLKSKGIIISNTPLTENEYREVRFATYHKSLAVYYQDREYNNVTKDWDIVNERTEEWNEKALEYTDKWMNSNSMSYTGRWYNSDELYIKVGDIIIKRSVGKSQLITEEYVTKVVEREKKAYTGAYGEFSLNINKMFREKFGNIGSIYPTTYGIGVWVFYNWRSQECIEKVQTILNDMGVEYRNEFSDAKFVYRFVISKKEVNRKKLVA